MIQQEETRAQKEENHKLLERIDKLQDQLSLLMRLLHGSKSEKRQSVPVMNGEQQSLFADSELSAELLIHQQEPLVQPEAAPKKRTLKTGRITFFKDLPVSQTITLKPDCDLTGAKLIGTEITTLLTYSLQSIPLRNITVKSMCFPQMGASLLRICPACLLLRERLTLRCWLIFQ